MLQTLKLNISCKRYTASQPQASINDCLTYQINKPHGEEVAIFALRFKRMSLARRAICELSERYVLCTAAETGASAGRAVKKAFYCPPRVTSSQQFTAGRLEFTYGAATEKRGGRCGVREGRGYRTGHRGETLVSSFRLQHWNSAISIDLFPPLMLQIYNI